MLLKRKPNAYVPQQTKVPTVVTRASYAGSVCNSKRSVVFALHMRLLRTPMRLRYLRSCSQGNISVSFAPCSEYKSKEVIVIRESNPLRSGGLFLQSKLYLVLSQGHTTGADSRITVVLYWLVSCACAEEDEI